MDINILKNSLNLKYYENLKNELIKNNLNNDWITDYINTLQKESVIVIKSPEIKIESNDDYLYKKAWNKLNQIHKVLKIKEFVKNLKINTEDESLLLYNELVELVKNKTLTKKESINYDEINGTIISISNLQYKDNKYYYKN